MTITTQRTITFSTFDMGNWIAEKTGSMKCTAILSQYSKIFVTHEIGVMHRWVFPGKGCSDDAKRASHELREKFNISAADPYIETLKIYAEIECPGVFYTDKVTDELYDVIRKYQFSDENVMRFMSATGLHTNMHTMFLNAWQHRDSNGFSRIEDGYVIYATFVSIDQIIHDYLNDVFGDRYDLKPIWKEEYSHGNGIYKATDLL